MNPEMNGAVLEFIFLEASQDRYRISLQKRKEAMIQIQFLIGNLRLKIRKWTGVSPSQTWCGFPSFPILKGFSMIGFVPLIPKLV